MNDIYNNSSSNIESKITQQKHKHDDFFPSKYVPQSFFYIYIKFIQIHYIYIIYIYIAYAYIYNA